MAPGIEIHDASFKLLFENPRAVADLFTGFVRRELGADFDISRLDLGSLEPWPAEYVSEELRQSRGDRVWRLRYRAADGAHGWVYLLVMLEFQSQVDPDMAVRVHAYTGQLYLQLCRGPKGRPGDRHKGPLPLVLPIVIYNGRARWSAACDIRDAIASAAPAGEALERFQPRQGYLLLDVHRLRPAELPEDNVVSARFALEHGDPEAVLAVIGALRRLLAGPEHARLRRAFAATLRHMLEAKRFGASDTALAARLRRIAVSGDLDAMSTVFAERLEKWLDERAEERAEERAAKRVAERLAEHAAHERARGEARGLERGLELERALLARLAGRKFGPDAASRLAAAVAGVDDPERLEEVGEAVILCASGAEFLARAEEIAQLG